MRNAALIAVLLAVPALAKPPVVLDYHRMDELEKRLADLAERLRKKEEFARKPRPERMIILFDRMPLVPKTFATEFEGKKLNGETLVKEIFEKWPAIQRDKPSEDALRILALLAPALKRIYRVLPTPKAHRYPASKPLMKQLDSPHLHIRKAAIECLQAMYSMNLFYRPKAPRAERRKRIREWKKRIEKMKR